MKKNCTKCLKKKPLNNFPKDKQKKDGYYSSCKECNKPRIYSYMKNNKVKKSIYDTKRRIKFQSKLNKQKRQYYKNNKKEIVQKNIIKHKNFPWKRVLDGIKQRCNNPKTKAYKRYGGRGIKVFITEKQIKYLWIRDKAKNMKKPTIDRINNDGDYILSNCRFIEHFENTARSQRKPVLQYNLKGKFIKSFNCAQDASRKTKLHYKSITSVARGIKNTGFIWRYKNV